MAGQFAARRGGSRPNLEKPPREWDAEELSSKYHWNPIKEGIHGAKEGSEGAKATEFCQSQSRGALPRQVQVDIGNWDKKVGDSWKSPVDGQDQPKIYEICDHTLKVLMHPSVPELHQMAMSDKHT